LHETQLQRSYHDHRRHGAKNVQRNALVLTTLLRFTLHHRQPSLNIRRSLIFL